MVHVILFFVFASVICFSIYLIDLRQNALRKFMVLLGVWNEDDDVCGGGGDSPSSFFRAMRKRIGSMLPGLAVGEYDQKLQWAGRPLGLNGEEFYLLKIVVLIGAVFLALAFFLVFKGGKSFMLVLLAAGVVGFYLPDYWLSSRVQERQKAIEKELLGFVDVLAVCAKAGLNLSEAIQRTSEYQGGCLGHEFNRALFEMKRGKSREEALRDIAHRTGVDEVDKLVRALIQGERRGVPISHMLEGQAELMRSLRRSKAQEMAQLSSVKILFPVIVCCFMPLMIILLGPAVLSLAKALGVE